MLVILEISITQRFDEVHTKIICMILDYGVEVLLQHRLML